MKSPLSLRCYHLRQPRYKDVGCYMYLRLFAKYQRWSLRFLRQRVLQTFAKFPSLVGALSRLRHKHRSGWFQIEFLSHRLCRFLQSVASILYDGLVSKFPHRYTKPQPSLATFLHRYTRERWFAAKFLHRCTNVGAY